MDLTDNTLSMCDRQGHCLFGYHASLTGPYCSVRCPDCCHQGNCDPVNAACLTGVFRGIPTGHKNKQLPPWPLQVKFVGGKLDLTGRLPPGQLEIHQQDFDLKFLVELIELN